jgi:predicted regulator of Ras-like GTPase activity (Roadblock/LC7/MglB family)
MDQILQTILDVAGVGAALVVDGAGALVAHRGKAVYDRALCEGLAPLVVKAADAVQLQQEDWEAISAQYADGKLLIRNLGAAGGRTFLLVIVADATLNPSFATVAIRVAANKLKKALAGAPISSVGSSMLGGSAPLPPPLAASAALAGSGSSPPPVPSPSDSSVLSGSGVAWSKGSSVGLSRVQAADPASGAFLSRCAKELARHVGPMAKVYVEEAVRRVAGDQPFAMPHAAKLLEDLGGQIEDADGRALFRRAIQKG